MNNLLRTNNKKIILSLLIAVILCICQCKDNAVIQPNIIDGFIDISDWNFNENGAIQLKGAWKYKYNFSEDNFLTIDFNNLTLQKFKVPGYWNSKEKESFGYCILKLKIKNNTNKKLGIYIEYANTAYELYINNDLYLKNGAIGKNRNASIPQNLPLAIELPQTEYLNIVWLISNFHDNYGGPTTTPIINTIKQMKYNIWIENLLNSMVMGIILMVSIYNMIFWLGRKKDKKSLLYINILFYNFFKIACYI